MKEIDPMDLISKFEESTLTELVYENNNTKLILKRESNSQTYDFPANHQMPAHPAIHSETPAVSTPVSTDCDLKIIKAPIVGTFYRSPSPDAPAYVEAGSTVKKGDTLCILEAMKSMNQLEAEFDCEIVKVLAESNQLVEFDGPLFEVRPL